MLIHGCSDDLACQLISSSKLANWLWLARNNRDSSSTDLGHYLNKITCRSPHMWRQEGFEAHNVRYPLPIIYDNH